MVGNEAGVGKLFTDKARVMKLIINEDGAE